MTTKRADRLKSTSGFFSYTLDYGQSHKQLDPTTPHQLLSSRDPELIDRDARAITVAADNCNAYDPEPDFRHERQLTGKTQKTNQAGSYVLSLDDKAWEELNTHLTQRYGRKPQEIEKYDELAAMGLELGRMVAGNGDAAKGQRNYQIAVQTHYRPNNHHVHIEVGTINLETGKKDMDYSHDELTKLYGYADKLYKERGLTTSAGLEVQYVDGHRLTQRRGGYDIDHQGGAVSTMVKKGRYSYIDDLGYQFELVMTDSKIKTKKQAIQALKDRHITVDQWDSHHKYLKMHWDALKVDIKSHGKVTQRAGTPSRSIRIKTYTRQEVDQALLLPANHRIMAANLEKRRQNYGRYGRIIDAQSEVSATRRRLSAAGEQLSDLIRAGSAANLQQTQTKRQTQDMEKPVSRRPERTSNAGTTTEPRERLSSNISSTNAGASNRHRQAERPLRRKQSGTAAPKQLKAHHVQRQELSQTAIDTYVNNFSQQKNVQNAVFSNQLTLTYKEQLEAGKTPEEAAQAAWQYQEQLKKYAQLRNFGGMELG